MKFNPYLYFDGNCKEAFCFYEKLFDGKILAMHTHDGTPAACQVPPEWQKKILHASLAIGDTLLMASDAPPGRFHKQAGFSISINLSDAQQAERIYDALAENAVAVTMPFGETFWAQRFAMLTDRFGIPWMINVEKAAAPASA